VKALLFPGLFMKNRPFLMALLTLGGIFAFFLILIVLVTGWFGQRTGLSLGAKVGVVEVEGVILSSRQTIEELTRFRDDDSVRAVVLRIDSPGGGVAPSQEICEEVAKLADVKPVVASMASVAASGGYYIAAPATRIIANSGSITGSIGVIMEFTNVEELFGKIGLRNEVVKSGQHKDIGSPVRSMTEGDRKILQAMIDDVHQQFIEQVASSRKLPLETVQVLADGRIFTGRQAFELGLVDQLGNLQDAIEAAAELAEIQGEPKVVYPRRSRPGLLEYLIQESASQLRQGLRDRGQAGMQFLWQDVH
jgi:protease-4